jgi:glycosyltransferase involved in cell wall biosynthesis
MIDSPLVSVICTCYNHEDFVVECLNSVQNQTYQNIELIVVDDFSTDGSVAVIKHWQKEHPKIVFVRNKENLGITKSFNSAVRRSCGKYLIDLAADDFLLPNCVEKLVQVYESSKTHNPSIVYGNAAKIDRHGAFISVFFKDEMIQKIKEALPVDFYRSLLSDSAYICSVSAMYDRLLFEELGGYDERLYFEDLDYWLRASKHRDVGFVDAVLVHKRFLPNSLEQGFFSRNRHTKKLHISMYDLLKKVYHLNTNKPEHAALIRRILKQIRWALKTLNFKYAYLYACFFLKVFWKFSLMKSK